MKKQKLEVDECLGLIRLMHSEDDADKIVALTALENSTYNLKQLLIIRLMTRTSKSLWQRYAPKATVYMAKAGKSLEDKITWDYVVESIYKDDTLKDDQLFAEKAFSDFITKTLKDLSPRLGRIATITIKLNSNGVNN
jgi:hypothetical protein